MRNNSSKGESTQSGREKRERTISCRINKLQEQTTKKNKKRKGNSVCKVTKMGKILKI